MFNYGYITLSVEPIELLFIIPCITRNTCQHFSTELYELSKVGRVVEC